MDLVYTFEPMSNGMFQVRMNGSFVCYSHDNDENGVDEYLKREGYKSRNDYWMACLERIDEIL